MSNTQPSRTWPRLLLLGLLLCPPAAVALELPKMNRRQRRQHLQPPGTPPPPPSAPATNLAPASIDGIVEDHAYEQYFFSEATRRALLDFLVRERGKERPLLLCAPSVALAAEAAGTPYLLLDRDERFAFLSGYRRFDLERPCAVDAGFDYDCVLCDPPFANFPLSDLERVLDALAGEDERRQQAPLFLCHHSKREDALQRAIATRSLVRLDPFGNGAPLGYESVKPSTARHIHLYGPEQ